MLQRSAGWNLGIAFVPDDARPALPDDLRASTRRARRDRRGRTACCRTSTARRAIRTCSSPTGGFWAIDYDACLYLSRALGPDRPPSTALPSGHLLAGAVVAVVEAPAIDFEALAAPAPEDWLVAAGSDRATLAGRLAGSYASWVTARAAPLHRAARESMVRPTSGGGAAEPG